MSVNAMAGRIFASPLARRLATEAGLDLASLTGSGPHGRIVERDVKSALAGGGARKAPAPERALAEAASSEATRKFYEIDSYEEVPHDSMRKAIARRLTESIQTVPHFYLNIDCEIDALLKLREEFNAAAPKGADGKPEWKTSVNDYIVKALALALQRVPDANVTFTPDAMLKHKASDIGVAVAIPGGLITPIIRNAQAKTVHDISEEIRELAARARERKLKPQEYEGGVSAVSNLGMYGIRNFSAVINPPQSTILAVGKGEARMVVKEGEPAVATIMSVTLSCDHRAVDGALGAELLGAFKALIEQPMALFA
ncbi:MAG: dihydrolipoyllysine acetyltransferase [Methylocystis sp.]|nr:MAG: dihydrolipoyllysine acetyltransferase [Methylocystis sp.]